MPDHDGRRWCSEGKGGTHLGMLEEQVASLLYATSVNIESVRVELSRAGVDLGHGLLDLLVVVAVLFDGRRHAVLLHKLVDRDFLSIGVDGGLVDDRVGDWGRCEKGRVAKARWSAWRA